MAGNGRLREIMGQHEKKHGILRVTGIRDIAHGEKGRKRKYS